MYCVYTKDRLVPIPPSVSHVLTTAVERSVIQLELGSLRSTISFFPINLIRTTLIDTRLPSGDFLGRKGAQHKNELTEVTPFVLNLQSPNAKWVLSPIMDGHEGPRMEPVARRIVRAEGQ